MENQSDKFESQKNSVSPESVLRDQSDSNWKKFFLENFYGYRTTPVSIIILNIIPLFGAWFLGWKVFFLVALYWVENVSVGIINVFKMVAIGRADPKIKIEAFKLTGFFIAHYGLFTLVHGAYLFGFISVEGRKATGTLSPEAIHEFLIQPGFWIAVVYVFIHHFYSYLRNFIDSSLFLVNNAFAQMWSPYGRMFILHIVAVISLRRNWINDNQIQILVILVGLKTALDLAVHYLSVSLQNMTSKKAS